MIQILQYFYISKLPADHLANGLGPPVVRGPQFVKYLFNSTTCFKMLKKVSEMLKNYRCQIKAIIVALHSAVLMCWDLRSNPVQGIRVGYLTGYICDFLRCVALSPVDKCLEIGRSLIQ
jgi:hypothetical protein